MPPPLLEAKQTETMLAILQRWDQTSGSYTDNTRSYFLLLLFKCSMDSAALFLCSHKRFRSLLSVCSLSVALADLLMVVFVAAVWFLRAGGSEASPCFFLAHASASFSALPPLMMVLGLLDYCLEDACAKQRGTSCRLLINALLTLLLWTLAVLYSFHAVSAEPVKLYEESGTAALACEVGESTLVTYFNLGLFFALLLALLPFWSRIPRWAMEADRMSDARIEHESNKSDLMFSCSPGMETESSEKNHLQKNHCLQMILLQKNDHLQEDRLQKNHHLQENHRLLENHHLQEDHRLQESHRLQKNDLQKNHRLQNHHLQKNHLQKNRLHEDHLQKNHHLQENRLQKNHHLQENHRLQNHRLQKNHLQKNRLHEDHLQKNHHLQENRLHEDHLEQNRVDRPPLWLSFTLCFSVFWMPYLVTCVACTLCGVAVPAYISVNLLWLECTNSLLVGLMFWTKSETRGPYNRLPENVCLWNVYWHLSRGGPSKDDTNSCFYV